MPVEIWFLGVSTASSLIHAALPRWGRLLGEDLVCRGIDLPLGSPDGDYLAFCDRLAASGAAGAVVTSHKTALYRACADRFSERSWDAELIGEINAVAVRGARLHGWAQDPVSTGRVVDRIWPAGGAGLVCLGGGGTAAALLTHLARRPVPPARATFCEPQRQRCSEITRLAQALRPRFPVDVAGGNGPRSWRSELAAAGDGALVVNATGMGKDRPGSPLHRSSDLPAGCIAWELNYRGSLEFLDQARARGVRVEDGWSLFCHGWAAALRPILDLPDDPGLGERFGQAAADLRPRNWEASNSSRSPQPARAPSPRRCP